MKSNNYFKVSLVFLLVLVLISSISLAGQLQFEPTDDTYIPSGSTTPQGDIDYLNVKGDTYSLLKFQVSGINGDNVESVVLRLRTAGHCPLGTTVHSVASNSWIEESAIDGTAPTPGTALRTLGSLESDTWYDFDITGSITADGIFSFALTDISMDKARWRSKEDSDGIPELIIITGGSSGSNISPNVYAGPDQASDINTNSGRVQLAGSADDGGDGPGPLVVTWSKLSGPGNVNFSSTSIVNPTAEFSAAGIYELQLLADDSSNSPTATNTDTIEIEVLDALVEGYFVALGGSDSNNGTYSQPWATIQHAVDSAVAGDIINVRGGKYHQSVTINNLDGTSDDPITIRCYLNEEVIIAGTMPVTSQWSVYSGNVYKTTVSQDIWQLFVDDKSMIIARWPNITKNWDEPDDTSGHNPTPGSFWDQETTWGHLDTASTWGHLYNKENNNSLSSEGKSFQGGVLNIFRCLVTGNDIVRETITSHLAGQSHFTHTTNSYPADSPVKKPIDDGRYYIEGDLDCLDSPGEWFYDKNSDLLYVWFFDSSTPDGHFIEARNTDTVLALDNCQYVNFSGITLFGGAFHLTGTKDVNFDECKFLYPSLTKTVLGETGINQVMNATDSAVYPANLSWTNCEFAFSEGRALALRTSGNLIENNYFHNSGWGPTTFGVVSDKKGSDTTYRRNTFHTIGRSNATKNGANCLLEYNRSYNFMFKGDSSGHQMPSGTQDSTVCRYNWVYNAYNRNGFRFDGDPGGTNGVIHHCVSMRNNRGFRLKGDQHQIYNLVGLYNGPKDDCNVALQKYYDEFGNQAGNINSIVRNIAAYFINPWPIPTIDQDSIWYGIGEGKTLESQLRDPDNLDFRPKAGSDLVNTGTHVPGFTDGYISYAPDIGAYEYGDTNYWIPGCKFKDASCPIPPDGTITAKVSADLMWLEGRDAVSHRVFFGPDPGDLTDYGTQANNIFNPGSLWSNTYYYWRVDTITANVTIRGQLWSFYTGSSGTPPPANRPPYFDTTVIHEPGAVAGIEFADTIGDQGFDLDGDPITFSIDAGPAWLTMAADGTTSGTPMPGHVGENMWTIRVTDDQGAYDVADMSITVEAGVFGDADINNNGRVDMHDLRVVSKYWQADCGEPLWCEGADLNFSGKVTVFDLQYLASKWLE
ncbi:MAG: hypothetical protein JEZ07_08675 [Phycisphaerae bacterium]|nr:hypothetical protein [Phycisphaerae bacterium]